MNTSEFARPAVWICLIALAAGASFGAARSLRGTANAQTATTSESAAAPDPNSTPLPGGAPDTSKPFWAVPYLNLDRQQPRFDQVINGIQVGPTARRAGSASCQNDVAVPVEPAVAMRSPVAFDARYLPSGAVLDRESAAACAGTSVVLEREFVIPPEKGVETRIRSGEISWFDAPHGGAFVITRSQESNPSQPSDISADRWAPTTVKGRPAAVAGPVLARGLGESAVVVWDNNILTVVTGLNITKDELVKIAEGLF